ncbi:HEAT repeat domain-containing protein [Streptomyces sp. AD55]|uniref:HEAT repeat domain-containing protein n=1 Tax=Streptomyces sp. AD55 TaxID=3242895 RepID=UPI003526EBDA
MTEWITAALCPQDVVPVNGRRQNYSYAATGLAYVIMGRLIEYDLWRDGDSTEHIPDLLNEATMPSPEWVLVRAALRSMLEDSQELGTLELIEFASNGELDPELRAIACVLASIGYADMERYSQSIAACERLLSEQLDLPASFEVMLQLHACLRNAEIKEYGKALDWANSAKLSLSNSSASGEYARKVYDALKFSTEENIDALSAVTSDNFSILASRAVAPTLWVELDATVGSAALEYMAEDYKQRIRDRGRRTFPRTLKNEDYISRNLYAYFVRTQLGGNWKKYLRASHLLGMERLLRPFGEQADKSLSFSQGLAYLRKGWATTPYEEALTLAREEGPLETLDSELQKALTRLQHGVTDLELKVLRAGAPLLRAEEADSVCRSLLETQLPYGARRPGGGWYQTSIPLWDAIAALAREISDGDYLAQHMRAQVGGEDSTQAFHLGKAAEVLDWKLVSPSEQERWVAVLHATTSVEGDWRNLLDTVLYKLCRTGNGAALQILDQLSETRMTLARAAHIINLPDEFGADLLRTHSGSIAEFCSRDIAETRETAAHGLWSFGGYNGALIGAIFSIRQPEQAIWNSVIDFIRDTSVATDHKDPVLDALALHIDGIPAEIRQRMASDPTSLNSVNPSLFEESGQPSGPQFRFLCATEAIGESEAFSRLARLTIDKKPSVRMEAVKSLPSAQKILGTPMVMGYLLSLTMDDSVFVRAQAAETLGIFLRTEEAQTVLLRHRLIEMLGADGVAVPFGALRGLQVAKGRREQFDEREIVETLRKIAHEHPLARVRKAANSLAS